MFTSLLLISVVLIIFYACLISKYIQSWKSIPTWNLPENFQPATKISVIIPARNEAENILKCLHSILNQNYPASLFEIIVVDDHSEDETAFLVKKLHHPNVKLLKLQDFIAPNSTQSFKKKAIEIAVENARGDLIITTDADCITPENWLNLLVSFYERKQLKFIAAPVNFYQERNLLERFQSLDFCGMMCVTGAGIHARLQNMCNGANLAYAKSAFIAVNGFQGIDHLASGDDMLLMHKIAQKYPKKIGFLKNVKATIYTTAKPTWKSFLSQRLRWATKNASYQDWKVTFVLAMVFFLCVNIVLTFCLIPFLGYFAFALFLGQLLAKALIDYWFLKMSTHFFQRKDLMQSFVPSQILHILYIVIVGIMGNLIKKYEWKGRKVS